eukprot:gene2956-3689_t
MWERFSFYGMRAILVLYLVDKTKGGLGWDDAHALKLYGFYGMAVYVLGIPGGWIADRYIGRKSAVLWGAIFACMGHFLLAMQYVTLFMAGLLFIALGTGLLKSNISTLVGDLYAVGDRKRDGGFTIFYMGINIGGLASSIAVGYVAEMYGWHYGFGLAGLGMLLGILVYIQGQKYLTHVGGKTHIQPQKQATQVGTKIPFSKEEKDRLWALALSFIAIFIFFTAYEQVGGLFNLYTDKHIDRTVFGWEIPASMFQSVNPIFIIILSPIVALCWIKIQKRYRNISSFHKLALGNIITSLGFLFMIGAALQIQGIAATKASLHWILGTYFLHTIGELCLSPVSLAFVTKLAPQRISASIMGIYFAVIGLAQYAAAWIGEKAGSLGDIEVFKLIGWVTLLIGIPFIIFNKQLRKLTHGAE